MKRSALTYCILSLFAILGFSACDVHEFPDMPERRPYELVLDFTNAIDMGFYQTIDYSRASTEASPSGTKTQTEITYDIRYTVNAYRIDGSFTGSAFDGYIRDGDPTGTKVGVESATYDFGYGLRRFNWGGQFGAEWQAYRHLSVYADLTCAANSIFKKDFHSVSFDMYNLYLTIGFGYRF